MNRMVIIRIPWAESLVPGVDFEQYIGQYVDVDGQRFTIHEANVWRGSWGSDESPMIELRCSATPESEVSDG